MKKEVVWMLAFWLGFLPGAHAEWADLSRGLPEADIRAVAADPRDPAVIFAASPARLFRSADGGHSWKRVLSIRGNAEARFIHVDPSDPARVYLVSARGVRVSRDAGKHWEWFFRGQGDSSDARCVAVNARDPSSVWVGTGGGLFHVSVKTGRYAKAAGLTGGAVYSILFDERHPGRIFASAEKGLYESWDGGEHWERVETVHAAERPEPTTLEQFDIEELSTAPNFSNVIFMPGSGKYYAAARQDVLESASDGRSWNLLNGKSLPATRVHYLVRSSRTFYAATDRGVFRWNEEGGLFEGVSAGLGSERVNALGYSPAGDFLIAGTARGVFRFSHPEVDLKVAAKEIPPSARDILAQFTNEPSIREIQNAAILYAEVHPDKIAQWRKAAARRSLLPTLSLKTGVDRDENVDLDRGGTADPDKFIQGPEERSFDWSAGVSWDLGELIWNDDQTSIDTRSRLMVELRDDVLNEVTHLYYSRRRLQVERLLGPQADLAIQIEKELKLQELTAGVDALTGGYLSERLTDQR